MKRSTAVSYLRVSGQKQIKGHGFTRQRQVIRRHAKANGLEIVGEYRDEGVSGTKGQEDRPAFQEMLAAMLANGARTILVESLDRLARAYRVQEQLLIYMASKGLALIAVNTGEDVTAAIMGDPMKRAMVQIQGIFSELETSQLVRKLRKAREEKRRDGGRCEGRKPYGTRPGEADTLTRMRQLRRKPRKAKRMSIAKIADQLNAEGRPTRGGKPWRPGSIHAILSRSYRALAGARASARAAVSSYRQIALV